MHKPHHQSIYEKKKQFGGNMKKAGIFIPGVGEYVTDEGLLEGQE
jgi:hypothetical protein